MLFRSSGEVRRLLIMLALLVGGVPQAGAREHRENDGDERARKVPSIEITAPNVIQFSQNDTVRFDVTVALPGRRWSSSIKKYRIQAFFPDENHEVSLTAGTVPGQFSYSTTQFDPHRASALTVKVLRKEHEGRDREEREVSEKHEHEHEKEDSLVASKRVPVFFAGHRVPTAEAFLRAEDHLSGRVRLLPGAVLKGDQSIAFLEVDARESDLHAVVSLDNQVLKRLRLRRGAHQWEVLLPKLEPAQANRVTLQLFKSEDDDDRPRALLELGIPVRVADDFAPDPRFPGILASELARLFTAAWSTSSQDPQQFVSSWSAMPELQFLAELFIESLGLPVTVPYPGPVPGGIGGTAQALDLNCDGLPDLALIDPDHPGDVSLLFARKGGGYVAPVRYSLGQNLSALAEADLRGKGRIDLVAADANRGSITVLLADLAHCGSFKVGSTYPVGRNPDSIAVGDLNSDGIADLAVANLGSDSVSILYGKGDGTFTSGGEVPAGPQPASVTIGVSAPSGQPQIVIANPSSSGISTITPLSGGGWNPVPLVWGIGTSATPFDWTGTEFKFRFPAPFNGGGLPGAESNACAALDRLYGNQQLRPMAGSHGGILGGQYIPPAADATDLESFFSSDVSADAEQAIKLAYVIKCKHLRIKRPNLSCEFKRKLVKLVTGMYPEDLMIYVVQTLVPGIPQELIDFIHERFHVCPNVHFDFSGIGCTQLVEFAPVIANLAVPGLGELLNNALAQFILENVLCMKLNCDNILLKYTVACLSLPPLPNIDVSFPDIDFGFGGHCWFGCGGDDDPDGDDGSGGGIWGLPGTGGGGGGGGGSGIGGVCGVLSCGQSNQRWFSNVTVQCSSLPPNVSSMTLGGLRQYGQAQGIDLLVLISSYAACDSPTGVPGFPDLNPPAVTIGQPADGSIVRTDTVLVSGGVSDLTSTITVNGVSPAVTVGAAGLNYSVSIPTPASGLIEVVAVDGGGNVGKASVTVLVPRPTALAFGAAVPASATVGTALGSPIAVSVLDQFGTPIAKGNFSVTLAPYLDSACSVPAGAGLTADANPVTTAAGLASFTGVSFGSGGTYYVGVSAQGLAPACSGPVTVTAPVVLNSCLPGTEVKFADPKFERIARGQIGVMHGSITPNALLQVYHLHVQRPITSLLGIECMKNLQSLHLINAGVVDLSPIASLSGLSSLEAIRVGITDISSLKGLVNLVHLELTGNRISDISSLANLTHLQELYLNQNDILDVAPLRGLANLMRLDLRDNQIADISPLASLGEHGISIFAGNNRIQSIDAFAKPMNITELLVPNNLIRHIPDLSGWYGSGAIALDVADNRIADLIGFKPPTAYYQAAGLWLSLSGNSISDISALLSPPPVNARVFLIGNPICNLSFGIAQVAALDQLIYSGSGVQSAVVCY